MLTPCSQSRTCSYRRTRNFLHSTTFFRCKENRTPHEQTQRPKCKTLETLNTKTDKIPNKQYCIEQTIHPGRLFMEHLGSVATENQNKKLKTRCYPPLPVRSPSDSQLVGVIIFQATSTCQDCRCRSRRWSRN
jgi:hypothetical protein